MSSWVVLCSALIAEAACQQTALTTYYEKYSFELLMVILLAALLANFVKGKKSNARVFDRFISSVTPFLCDHFSHCGSKLTETESLKEKPETVADVVDEESPFHYQLFLTGRVNCKYALVTVVTRRRQDLLTSLVYSLLFPEKDRFFFEVTLPAQPSPKGIFYLVRTRQARKKLQEFEDMRTLCTRQTVPAISNCHFSVYAEGDDIASHLLEPSVVEAICGNVATLETLEVSDCVQSEANRPVSVKVSGVLLSAQPAAPRSLIALALRLADKYNEYVAPRRLAEKLEHNRRDFYAQKTKEKKKEEMEGSHQSKWSGMTEEEKSKKREKEEKRVKKKAMKTVVVGKA